VISKSGEERGFQRPHICVDDSCFMLWSRYTKELWDKGTSFTCCGRLTTVQEFKHKETVHSNTHSYCIYTPLKGLIRFFINHEDAWGDILALDVVIGDSVAPWQCISCGVYGSTIGTRITQYADGVKLCDKCAVREGKWYFDEKERKWRAK